MTDAAILQRYSGRMAASTYDPFVRGCFPVGVRTTEAFDSSRNRLFPCEVWYPAVAVSVAQDVAPETRDAEAEPGVYPLILYSHASMRNRRASTFLCTHLASHGYVVAALDHSEIVGMGPGTTVDDVIGNRVPDIRFLCDHLLQGFSWDARIRVNPEQIGVVGHSFGGWTALAAVDEEPRIRAVVALAPGGATERRPGILPLRLAFQWGREVPTLLLVAEDDTLLPLAGMHELFERTPGSKQMVILHRADHLHFLDNVEAEHDAMRSMNWSGDLSWISREMRPSGELCSGAEAHLFVRGLTLCYFDAALLVQNDSKEFLSGDLEGPLARLGVHATLHKSF